MQLSPNDYDRLLEILEGLGLEVDRTRIRRQLNAGYNTITLQDKNSPHQADFIIHTEGKLEKRGGSLLGLRTYYQTPESLILAKLRMVKATRPRERSLKDREDILAILRNTRVNLASIVRAAREETTLDVWEALQINERLRRKAPKGRDGARTIRRRRSKNL